MSEENRIIQKTYVHKYTHTHIMHTYTHINAHTSLDFNERGKQNHTQETHVQELSLSHTRAHKHTHQYWLEWARRAKSYERLGCTSTHTHQYTHQYWLQWARKVESYKSHTCTRHTHTHTCAHKNTQRYSLEWERRAKSYQKRVCYGVATTCRLLIIIGLFCKRAL